MNTKIEGSIALVTGANRGLGKALVAALLAALPGPIDTDMVKGFELPKASAADTAQQLIAGIGRGDEEIFPDPMALQMGAFWLHDPKAYERAFASL